MSFFSSYQTAYHRNRAYYLRFQLAVIGILILFILLFRFWPAPGDRYGDLDMRFADEEEIGPEFIMASPEARVERIAPPVVRPDVAEPADEVMDVELDLELGESVLADDFGPFAEEGEPEIVTEPDRPPRVRRIVEPVTPSRARNEGVRAQIAVLFIVSKEGEVIDVIIDEMKVYNPETGQFETVSATGYGFREITLQAARQWLFHPAEFEGEPVRSQTRHFFTFGS